jgi:hypothetical protein
MLRPAEILRELATTQHHTGKDEALSAPGSFSKLITIVGGSFYNRRSVVGRRVKENEIDRAIWRYTQMCSLLGMRRHTKV